MNERCTELERSLPDKFWACRYDAGRFPGAKDWTDIARGANCQTFAYAVLRHFGLTLPALRSSELWRDNPYTFRVSRFEPLDLLLFSRGGEAYGAHVGIFAGRDRVLHLCKRAGYPTVWELSQFLPFPEYRVLLGGKRVLRSEANQITPKH